MSEYEHNLPASDDPEWVGLVANVENRFAALNDALTDLRSAVIRLSAHRPQPQEPRATEEAARLDVQSEILSKSDLPSEAAVALEDAVRAFEAAAEVPETPEAATVPVNYTFGVVQPLAKPAEEDTAKREEVSRMVAEARQQLTGTTPRFDGSWATPANTDEIDSTSEGSWPIARHAGLPINPPSSRAPIEDPTVGVSSGLEPVGNESEALDDADDGARRDEVARMVADMQAGFNGDSHPVEDASPVDDTSLAQEVGDTSLAEEDEAARREGVADMVARMRTEMAAESAAPESSAAEGEIPQSEDEVRDEVRRAVEAAKAEMASGWVMEGGGSLGVAAGERKFSFPDWQNTHIEPSGPPVIVIKDPEGRVELARVYETLSQVNCDENAALLNYTPHSVTVGLNLKSPVPTKEAMEQAIETVFGRKCRVESDGVRVSVDIGMGKEDAA